MRVWVWTRGAARATVIPALDVPAGFGDPPLVWIDERRLAVLAYEPGAARRGNIPFGILRGRNAADGWKRAFEGVDAAVAVQQSGISPNAAASGASGAASSGAPEARGRRRRPGLTGRGDRHGDRHEQDADARPCASRLGVARRMLPRACCASGRACRGQPVAGFFDIATRANNVDAGYTAVNWGTEREVFDLRTGAEITPARRQSSQPPRRRAPSHCRRRRSAPAVGDADADRPRRSSSPMVTTGRISGSRAEAIVRFRRCTKCGVRTSGCATSESGRAESFSYTMPDGATLTAWLLLPARSSARRPSTPSSPSSTRARPPPAATPNSLSPYHVDFEHPQLFAALGYAVLLPSMPAPKRSGRFTSAAAAALRRDAGGGRGDHGNGVADPDRLGVMGHSGGGFRDTRPDRPDHALPIGDCQARASRT